jgi:hypothetical protein
MKFPVALLASLVLLSCNEQRKPEPAPRIQTPQNTALPTPASNPFAPTDLSPMDISYFPVDYPKMKMSDAVDGPPLARVIYSRPRKQGRAIFGSLIPFGQPWRLGANEATELQLFQNATILGKGVGKGRYTLYCIPQAKEWTITLNSNVDSWGLHYDSTKNVHSFKIPVESYATPSEYFTMVFENSSRGASLLMAWDTTVARLPIQF